MNKISLPKIGSRNLKTALSVLSCMVLFELMGRNNPLYACIAAIICMKDTVESSFQMGKDRLIGTMLGGLLGVVFIFIVDNLSFLENYKSIVSAVGIVIAIYICTIMQRPGSVTICCIVFIGIMISYDGPSSYIYAVSRSIDTSIGIILAIFINKYVNPPEEKIEDKVI